MRRYSPDARASLSTHYDVSACATAIVPLVPADQYGGGLYVQVIAGIVHYILHSIAHYIAHYIVDYTVHNTLPPRARRRRGWGRAGL